MESTSSASASASASESDECRRPECSNELRGGKFSDDEAAGIVRELVRGLVERVVRVNS